MEGFILSVSPSDPKKTWKTVYLKLDEISGQLLAFTDRAQAVVHWKLALLNADVATPVPGDPKHDAIPNLDETPHCFYVRETTAGSDQWHFFSASDDANKKQWIKTLQQAANEGPRSPRFGPLVSPRSPSKAATPAVTSGPTYAFMARVAEVRTNESGKHAEYRVLCHCEIFSRLADRRLTKEWSVWHRFSEFDALNEALKVALGEKMSDVPFYKYRSDALRWFVGRALEQSFLDERRLQLDTFISRVCAIENVVEFFKPHANQDLKKFFVFDENCEDVDHASTPRKTSESGKPPRSPTKANKTPEPSQASESASGSPRKPGVVPSPVAAAPATVIVQAPPPPQEPVKNTEEDNTTDKTDDKNSRRSKKKNKKNANKNNKTTGPVEEVEVVRQPSPAKTKLVH